MTDKVLVIDAQTGESYERPLTDEEIAQRAKDTEENEQWILAEEAKAQQKQNALQKLAALGLDEKDLKALGF